jgi:polyisoprenoid-binding protein YceI
MTSTPGPTRRAPILAVVAMVALAIAGAGLWYLFLRPAGPAPVSLGSAAPTQVAETTTGAPASEDPTEASSAEPAESQGDATRDAIEGTWAVDPSVGSFTDFSSSFVGYRVRETLANIGATEAVGRTPEVTGSLVVEGTTISAADFTADLTTLESDDDRRDGQLRQQALETGQFPEATFVLTQPIELGEAPTVGATLEVTAVGDLTLHGVTNSVEIPLEGKVSGHVVTIVGSLPIAFADYGMDSPRSMIVLSVEDHGVMELQLQLTRA